MHIHIGGETERMVELCDVTLREGEQTPGAVFDLQDKLELAGRLDNLGIAQIQVSFPGLDAQRLDEAKAVCSLPLRCKTEVMTNGMAEDWRERIAAACACGPDIVHSMVDARAACVSAAARRKALAHVKEICDEVHAAGKLCNISFIGAFDADREGLIGLIRGIVCCADRLRVADSYGIATPEDVYAMVSAMAEARGGQPSALGLHCHDDMGLAMANMLAGVHAGADFVDVSINGLGSRAGNVPLATCAYVLDRVYHLSSGIDLTKLRELSQRTGELCGISVPPRTALVGEQVFDEEIDIHVLELLNHAERRGLRPETVGGEAHALYGKLTTAQVLHSVAQYRARDLTENRIPAILASLRDYSLSHRGEVLDEEGLWDIVDEIQKNEIVP